MGKIHQKRAQAAANAAARGQADPSFEARSAASSKGHQVRKMSQLKADRDRAEKVGLNQRGEQGWVPVSLLFSDPRYQRDVDRKVVERMAREFDPDALGVIYVSERDNGTYAVMDGGHRVATMRHLGWDDQKMPALIYAGLTVEEEAHIFHEMNAKRRLPKRIDLFRAEVTSGDLAAIALNNVFEETGVKASPAPGSHNLRAIATVQKAMKITGPEIVSRSIALVLKAWETHDDALNGDVLNGIMLLLYANPDIDDKHLARALSNHTPGLIQNKAKATKEVFPHLNPAGAVATVLTTAYNQRKRTGRLPSPFYTGWPRITASGALFGNGWSESGEEQDDETDA